MKNYYNLYKEHYGKSNAAYSSLVHFLVISEIYLVIAQVGYLSVEEEIFSIFHQLQCVL